MIYIGTDEGIYRWYRGTPWPIFHSLQDRAIVAIGSPGAGILAVLDSLGRVLETSNNGTDWREVPVPERLGRPLGLTLAGVPAEILLVAKPMAIYRRPVGAVVPTGRELGPFVAPTFIRGWLGWARQFGSGSTAVATKASSRAPATSDLMGWTALGVPQVAARGLAPVIRSLVVSARQPSSWFASVSGAGLWRSDDAGTTWEPCPGLPAEVYAIRTVSGKAGFVAAGTADGCWISGDNGRTWEERSGGLDQVRQIRALEIHPEDPDVMLAGAAPIGSAAPANGARGVTRFALYETGDGGKTWKHVRRGFPETFEYDVITDIRYDPAAPENAIVALDSGELWRTRNGGDWWEPIARQIRAARVLCAVV
jgi:photosystem II stability/assembly factor-like uncharacterized protein